MMIDINDVDEFNMTMKQAEKSGKAVMIKFYAVLCDPCKNLAPLYEKLAKEYSKSIDFCRVNIDISKELCSQLEIKTMPTILAFKMGKMIGKCESADICEIESLIVKLISP